LGRRFPEGLEVTLNTKGHRIRAIFRLLSGLFLLLLIGGEIRQRYLRWNYPPYGGARWQRDEETKAFEAVFRYQIAENRHRDEICFLSVRNAAPDRALMQRFADLSFVLPLSARFQLDEGNFRDRVSGRPALKFWLDRLNWETDTELHVRGGGAAAMRSGDSCEFAVRWQHGVWRVESYTPSATF
jgi:hypothetical protein